MSSRHMDENKNNSFNIAIKYLNQAVAYRDMKQYKNAEKYFLKIVDLFEDLVSPYSCEEYWSCLATAYSTLGVMLHDTDDLLGAQAYYLCAIDVMEGRVDEGKLEYVPNLVACYSNLGDLTKNEECFRKGYDYAKMLPENLICKGVIETWRDTFK